MFRPTVIPGTRSRFAGSVHLDIAVAFSKEKLTGAEIKTLEEVEAGRGRRLLSAEVLDRLIQWSLVEKTTGGLALTPLSCSPFQVAGAKILCSQRAVQVVAAEQGRRRDQETTVDHALMRGLVTAGPVMRRGASSV
jgi:hypothetical protein